MTNIDLYFESLNEEYFAYMIGLRGLILKYHSSISEEWKYGTPFYYFNKRPFCYLYINKQTGHPYIGIVRGNRINHDILFQGDRKKMKIIPLDLSYDIPRTMILEVFDLLTPLY